MTVATIAKTIGSTGKFSTVQLWEDGAPADLTTAEKSAAGTFLVAAFTQGETLSFVGSGAAGKLLDTDSTGAGNGTYVTYGLTSGNPAASDVVTGATSGATCVLSSGTPTNVGVIWQGQCQNQEFTVNGAVITFAGTTSSSTCYKELTTAAGASFIDNANVLTNPLRYDATVGSAIRTSQVGGTAAILTEDYARINKLQVKGVSSQGLACRFSNVGNIGEFLICEGLYTNTLATLGVFAFNNSVTSTLKNSVVILKASSANHIIATSTASPSIYNCTFVASDDLATAPVSVFLSGASGTVTVQNCSLFAGDSTKAIKAGSATFTFTTCYSDISGTTGVTQATYANEFVDVNNATADFRLKSGAAEIDTGTTDSTNAPTDIIGTLRPQGAAYDVGCWEYKVAGGFFSRFYYDLPAGNRGG